MFSKFKIHKIIRDQIRQNISRSEIAKNLSSQYKEKEYKRILNDYPEPKLHNQFKIIYLILIISLIIILVGKVTTIFLFGTDLGWESGIALIAILSGLIPALLLIGTLSGRAYAYKTNILYILYSLVMTISAVQKGGLQVVGLSGWFGIIVALVALISSIFLLFTIFPRLNLQKTTT